MRKLTLILMLAVISMTACEMRAEVLVNEDGSGTFGFVFGVEPFFLKSFAGMPGEGPLDMFRDELEDSGVPWQIKDFKEPGLEGIRATLPFKSPEDLQNLMYDLGKAEGGLFGSGDNLDESVAIAREGKGWSFHSAAFTPAGRTQEDVKGTPLEGSPLVGALGGFGSSEQLDKAFRFEYQVTLPGAPGATNATEVSTTDGATRFLWRIGAYDTEQITLKAATVPAAPRFPVVPAAAGFLLLATAAVMTRDRWMPHGSGPPPVVLEGLPAVPGPAGSMGAALAPSGPAPQIAGEAPPEPSPDAGNLLTDDLF